MNTVAKIDRCNRALLRACRDCLNSRQACCNRCDLERRLDELEERINYLDADLAEIYSVAKKAARYMEAEEEAAYARG